MNLEAALEPARAHLQTGARIVVLTGAGVSAESGVPTFRDATGLWKRFRPEDLATPEAFRRDPRLVWEWYGWRRETVRNCVPNPAHRGLARFQSGRPGVSIITQNVDDLHERAALQVLAQVGAAGGPAGRFGGGEPLHLHGSLFRSRCTVCPERFEDRQPVDASGFERLPRCPACGALARPDVVWFGEVLHGPTLEDAFHRAREADVCLVVGTSSLVYPAASLPWHTRAEGGVLIEVNPRETALTPEADLVLQGSAGEIIPQLVSGIC